MREQKTARPKKIFIRSGGSSLEFHGCHRHPLDRDALHLEQGGGQAHPLRRQNAPVCSDHLCLQVILFLSDNSILRVPYLLSGVGLPYATFLSVVYLSRLLSGKAFPAAEC